MQTLIICDNNHVKIAHEGKECPLCAAVATLDDIGKRAEVLAQTLDKLKELERREIRYQSDQQASQ